MTPVQAHAGRDPWDDRPPFSDVDPALTFHKRWQWIVGGEASGHLALLAEDGSLTYGELDRLSSVWAEAIVAGGFRSQATAGEPSFVAVLCDQSIEAIVAALACLKAGTCYLPLDAHAPTALLLDLLERTQPGCLLTPPHLSELAGDLARQKRLPLLTVDCRSAGRLPAKTAFARGAMDSDRESGNRAALLLFTSGSTGQSKGMLITYRRLLCSGWYPRHNYGLRPGDRVSHMFNLNVGGSLSDVYGALLTGATLCPFDMRNRDLGAIAAWLRQRQITLFHPPVTLFRELVEAYPEPEHYASVRLLVLAGQTVRHDDLTCFRRLFPPDCRLVNRLALSEIGIAAQMFIDHTTPITTETVPVGYAPAGVALLPYEDGRFLPLPTNEPLTAEIAIHSPGMTWGYWRQPELTAERFVPDPENSSRRIFLSGDLGRFHPDGLLEHLGRKDLMVKIRGYRVELTSVEQALSQIEGVKEAVVIAQEGEGGEKRLLAYLVPTTRPPMRISALRQALAQTLPPAMIPSVFCWLEALPLTANGKIDRVALAAYPPAAGRPELDTPYVPPTSPLEVLIAGIWAEVLGLVAEDGRPLLGIHDHFLDLGGNSILAARIVARLNREWPDMVQGFSLGDLLAAPTVAAMAAVLQRRNWERLLAEIEHLSEQEALVQLKGLQDLAEEAKP